MRSEYLCNPDLFSAASPFGLETPVLIALLKDRHDLVRSKAKQRDKELLEQERASNYGRDIGFLQEQEQEHAVKWSGQIRYR
ncbi:hypothetical protein V6N13_101665 [Hibiscus sabdariffa]